MECGEQLWKAVPELLQYPGTLLYIGASGVFTHFIPELKAVGHEISVLEIWPPCVEELRGRRDIDYLICGDVRDVDLLELPHDCYDVVLWFHGPEHVAEADLASVLGKLEELSPSLIVLGCPWGVYEVGTITGNPYEAHLSHLYPQHFEELGYETSTLGRKNTQPNNLLAWKKVTQSASNGGGK